MVNSLHPIIKVYMVEDLLSQVIAQFAAEETAKGWQAAFFQCLPHTPMQRLACHVIYGQPCGQQFVWFGGFKNDRQCDVQAGQKLLYV